MMKHGKIILITTLLSLVLMSNYTHGQQKSKEALGNSIVASIVSNDIDNFKSLLLPKKVVLELRENNDLENIDKEARDSLMTQYKSAYDHMIIPRYENNFKEIVNLNETHDIDWSNLNYVILYQDSSKDEEYIPFLIHTRLINSAYNHFYFGAVRYKGEWYMDGKLEITKDEKYAP
jgi:hypothetical protein